MFKTEHTLRLALGQLGGESYVFLHIQDCSPPYSLPSTTFNREG